MPWLTDVHITDVDSSFGDYQLEQDLIYVDNKGERWVTPAGFIGDLSSIPALLRPFIPKTILGKAPWLHDFIYQFQPRGSSSSHRKQADSLYHDGAIDEGMSKVTAKALYLGLRVGGWMVWNKYKKEASKKRIDGKLV